MMKWERRTHVTYVWDMHSMCVAFAVRKSNGDWEVKHTPMAARERGVSAAPYGPFPQRHVAEVKLARLVNYSVWEENSNG